MKNFSNIEILISSEQLKTMQYLPKHLARSLQDSVFPVPAGPCKFAPNFICKALVIVY